MSDLGKKRAEELGLVMHTTTLPFNWYKADDIHQLLGEGLQLFGEFIEDIDEDGRTGGDFQWGYKLKPEKNDTRTALLIGNRPIVKDTAESLLAEIVKIGHASTSYAHDGVVDVIMRARTLLERQKK